MMAEILATIRQVGQQSSVMFARQEKMLRLTKEEYRAVFGSDAPSLRELRNRAAHRYAGDPTDIYKVLAGSTDPLGLSLAELGSMAGRGKKVAAEEDEAAADQEAPPSDDEPET
jgi:hypothetical protein